MTDIGVGSGKSRAWCRARPFPAADDPPIAEHPAEPPESPPFSARPVAGNMFDASLVERVCDALDRAYAATTDATTREDVIRSVLAEYHAALAEVGMAVLPLEATEKMQRAGWIDKE